MADVSNESQNVAPVCSALQATSAAANERLRDLNVALPDSREEITGLSRSLVELQTVARLLLRHAHSMDAPSDDPSQFLPATVMDPLKDMVVKISGLVAEILQTIDELSNHGRNVWGHPDLGIHLSKLSSYANMAETSRLAANIAVDAMNFTPPSPAGNPTTDLPSYQSTQLLQDSLNVRTRITSLEDNDTIFPVLRPTIVNFLDSLQHHVQDTTGSLLVPPPPDGAGLPTDTRSEASSMHSELIVHSGHITPAYDPIQVNNPAPASISVRHNAKKDICDREIMSVHFTRKEGKRALAVSTDVAPLRIINLEAYTVTQIRDTGRAVVFAGIDSSNWAYVAEESNYHATHQSLDIPLSKPQIIVGSLATNSKHRIMRWPGARPLAFSPDGKLIAVTDSRYRLCILNAEQGVMTNINTVINSHFDTIAHAVFAPDCTAIITVAHDGYIRVSDPYTREHVAKLDTGSNQKPTHLGITPDGEVVVSVWGDTVFRWNYITSAMDSYSLSSRRGKEGVAIALSADCRFIACQTHAGVDIGNAHNGSILFTIHFQAGYATAASFSPNATLLALGKSAHNAGLRTTRSTIDIWELVF